MKSNLKKNQLKIFNFKTFINSKKGNNKYHFLSFLLFSD